MHRRGVSAEDGLILHDPEAFREGAVRVVAWFVALAFVATIVAVPVIDRLAPEPMPELVGDEAQDEKRLREQADPWDGSLARLVERDLRLTSRVRAEVAPHWAYFLFDAFQLTDERVVVGPNGWVFMPIRLAPREGATDEDVLRFGLSSVAALDRVVAARGVDLVLVPLPRKCVTHPEHLPRDAPDPRPALYRQLVERLAGQRVPHVDLLDRFLAEARTKELYFPVNTHWSDWGAAVAAEETCRQLGWLLPPEQRTDRLEERGHKLAQGDLKRYMGIDEMREIGYPTPLVQLVDAGGNLRTWAYQRELERMPDVAVAGTSSSERRKFIPFLRHFSGLTIWNGARRGGNPIEPLRALVTRPPGDRPRTVLVELPFHQVTIPDALKGCAQLVADLFPQDAPELDVSAGLQVDADFAEPVRLFRSYVDALSLPKGLVNTDAHAALGIRLEASAEHPVDLIVAIEGREEQLEWDPSSGPFVVPIRAERPLAGLRLELRSAARGTGGNRFELTSAAVVSGLDETTARRARLDPARAVDGGVLTTARLEAAPLPARSALRVELGGGGAPADVVVTLFEGERSLARSTWRQVLQRGLIVVDLAPLGEASVTRAVIEVEGELPPAVTGVVLAGTPTAVL